MNPLFPLTALAAVPAMIAPAVADAPAVFPTPQKTEFSGAYTRATEVQLHYRAGDSSGPLWEGVPAGVNGAYGITISAEGHVDVCVNDDDAAFYAKQTLSQLLRGVPGAQDAQHDPFPDDDIEAVARKGELPVGSVRDWPDLKYRGTVEGYYGIPWGYEARKSQFAFYGRNKMNFYIYAPKDDPLHHGEGCYRPYPEDKELELASLVRIARANHVHFVWAIHPANTVDWNDDDGRPRLDGLCRKLQMMYDLGVRDFGVLVDDSFGEIGKVERQIQLTNYIVENFIRKHPDVNQDLIMCPTGYNRAWAREEDLRALGERLDKDVMPMWTGNTVVCDITLDGQRWVNERLQRPTFIWWNWPCNDMKPSRLSMGRTYGLDQAPEMKQQMSGFVANPMERSEASKVGLFGVADYTWNIGAFDSQKAWKEGIRRLYPQYADAMQLFCNHNSDLLPNTHNYAREESVDLAPTARRFRDTMAASAPDEETDLTMTEEFRRIRDAGDTLRDARGLSALQREIEPWIRAFRRTGDAGVDVMEALKTEDLQRQLELCFHAGRTLEETGELLRDAWQGNHVEQVNDVQVGSKVITPSVQSALRLLNARLYSKLAGIDSKVKQPAFSTNRGNATTDVDNMFDYDLSTGWSNGEPQQAGDWVCLDLGEVTPIHTVYLLMGGDSDSFPYSGQIEISENGENWQPLGDVQHGRTLILDLAHAPVPARMVRYRITEPNKDHPLSIQTFRINGSLPASLKTTMEGLGNLTAYSDSNEIALTRVLEVATAAPGSYIRMTFSAPTPVTGFRISLDNPKLDEWAKFEVRLPAGTWQPLPLTQDASGYFVVKPEDMPTGPIMGMSLTNAGSDTQQIRLSRMAALLPPTDPETDVNTLRDSSFATSFNCGRSALSIGIVVPEKATEVLVIGTADNEVEGAELRGREGAVTTYSLKPDTKMITVKAPQQDGKRIYEVIFK